MHYGLPTAREVRDRAKEDELDEDTDFIGFKYSLFFALSSVLAFGIPLSYFKHSRDVDRRRFEGDGINVVRWRAFLRALQADWTDSNLLVYIQSIFSV